MNYDVLFSDILNNKIPLNTDIDYHGEKIHIGIEETPRSQSEYKFILVDPKRGKFIVDDETVNITEKFYSMVDNNLKVMKFRLKPHINIERLKTLKCLILGSGTLGCNIARNLLGWGIINITFVDNSNVSVSNLTRQTLYMYKDLNKPKALVAAERMQDIYPGFNAEGIKLEIPLVDRPGLYTEEELKNTIDKFETLISSHDVIFICTDNKESRWLPTVIGKHFDKLVFNVAVGFRTWLAMRHPNSDLPDSCCYFCPSITVNNTEKDRSIDQLCTVTHIATTFMAAAAAVDIFINIIHNEEDVPPQVRGNLIDYGRDIIHTGRSPNCCACGEEIQEVYQSDLKYKILYRIMSHGDYLKTFTKYVDIPTDDVIELSEED